MEVAQQAAAPEASRSPVPSTSMVGLPSNAIPDSPRTTQSS
jgi:hypothetical protein